MSSEAAYTDILCKRGVRGRSVSIHPVNHRSSVLDHRSFALLIQSGPRVLWLSTEPALGNEPTLIPNYSSSSRPECKAHAQGWDLGRFAP